MAGACVCRLQRLQADAGSDSLLFSIGYRWGISIDRLFSTTSLKRIRENFTSRHGKKKKSFARLALLGFRLLSLLLSLQQVGEAGFEPT